MPGLLRRRDGYDSDDDSSVDSDIGVEKHYEEEDFEVLNKERSRVHAQKMVEARSRIRNLVGTKITVNGHTHKKKKIEWTVVNEHVSDDNYRHNSRRTCNLGIRNRTTLDAINRSSVTLADLFLFLSFKDGNYWSKLGKLNTHITEFNDANEFRPNFRKL